jgi:hypothetical protein
LKPDGQLKKGIKSLAILLSISDINHFFCNISETIIILS